MPDQPAAQSPTIEQPGTKPKAVRISGDNRYPKYDLNSCLALAEKVKNGGGNDCTVEQLGALLGYKNTNGGGFATRVANAKMFGLIETVQGRYRTTPRAETILYPATPNERQQALVDAFLSVPVYKRIYETHKGQRLPEALGMQNLLHRDYQIPAGEPVILALRVLMDSAEQTGFFTATQGKRTNLVIPIMGASGGTTLADTPPPDSNGRHNGGGGGGGNGGNASGRGKLVDGVLDLLPEGDAWSEALMQDWLTMLTMALRVRYQVPSPTREGS
jgi:hypothetical protein